MEILGVAGNAITYMNLMDENTFSIIDIGSHAQNQKNPDFFQNYDNLVIHVLRYSDSIFGFWEYNLVRL